MLFTSYLEKKSEKILIVKEAQGIRVAFVPFPENKIMYVHLCVYAYMNVFLLPLAEDEIMGKILPSHILFQDCTR